MQPLGSQLKHILTFLSYDDSYQKKRNEEMNLAINLFITEHKLEALCREVREFVRICCISVLRGIRTVKVSLNIYINIACKMNSVFVFVFMGHMGELV